MSSQDGSSLEPSDATDSCRSLFRKLNILPIASLRLIFPLMLFIIDNQKDFLTNAYVHDLVTRNNNHLYLSDSCRSLFRKHNILPIACQYILSLMLFIEDKKTFSLTHMYTI